jgi:predicted transposase YbfD/YdcC
MQQVFVLRRETLDVKKNKTTEEIACGLTSLDSKKADPVRILALNRNHWGIENRLHYVRDVTFEEDGSRIRTRNAPRVMASLRNLVISLLRLVGINSSIPQALRQFAAKPNLALRLIGL